MVKGAAMRRMFFNGVLLGSVTTTVVLIAATAFAGTGIGAVFNLGRTNTVNAMSTLTGSTAGRMLQVTNTLGPERPGSASRWHQERRRSRSTPRRRSPT
jgi:hypothetical protein